MRRRRGRRHGTVDTILTLDSLVDVVTNINGMLLLLAVFTTLLALGKTYKVGFPVARPSEKAPVFFECRYNRVYPIKTRGEYSPHYHVTQVGTGRRLLLKGPEGGTTLEALQDPQADFSQVIATLDPEQQYAAFIVRSDSFESFRAARDVLRPRGIEVGWEPMAINAPLIFVSGGGQVIEAQR